MLAAEHCYAVAARNARQGQECNCDTAQGRQPRDLEAREHDRTRQYVTSATERTMGRSACLFLSVSATHLSLRVFRRTHSTSGSAGVRIRWALYPKKKHDSDISTSLRARPNAIN